MRVPLVICIVCITVSLNAQDISGRWAGTSISTGASGRTPIELDLKITADSLVSGTWKSSLNFNSIKFYLMAVHGVFNKKLNSLILTEDSVLVDYLDAPQLNGDETDPRFYKTMELKYIHKGLQGRIYYTRYPPNGGGDIVTLSKEK